MTERDGWWFLAGMYFGFGLVTWRILARKSHLAHGGQESKTDG